VLDFLMRYCILGTDPHSPIWIISELPFITGQSCESHP